MSDKETNANNVARSMVEGESSAGPEGTTIMEFDKKVKAPDGTMILEKVSIERPSLVGISSPFTGKIFEIDKSDMIIGRNPNTDIPLEDAAISVEHAKVRYENDSWQIVDLGSLNGTFVNGQTTVNRFLNSGDVVKFGPIEFRFALNDQQARNIASTIPDAPGTGTGKSGTSMWIYIVIGFLVALAAGGAFLFLR